MRKGNQMRLTHQQLEENYPVGKTIQIMRLPVYDTSSGTTMKITKRTITKTERSDRNGLMVWFKGIKGAFVVSWNGQHIWRSYPRQVRYELV